MLVPTRLRLAWTALAFLATGCASLDEKSAEQGVEGVEGVAGMTAISMAAAPPKCLSACAHWNAEQTRFCEQAADATGDCSIEHERREDLCATLTAEDCHVPELIRRFRVVDSTCDPASRVSSRCSGASLISECKDGSISTTTCDATQCPAEMPRALGCRIDADHQAFCECGCVDGTSECAGAVDVGDCVAGEWITRPCTQQACDEARLGALIGCGEALGGGNNCICESQ